jgi:hypothetical protein
MTDYRSNIAATFHTSPVPEITAILDEGAITVSSGFGTGGRKETMYTVASELHEGDWVALSNDAASLFVETGGKPIVEKASNNESLVMFEIVTIDPAENYPANDAAANTLAKRLAGKFYRKARVRVYGGITAVVKADVMCNGTNATVPGVGATLTFNITSSYANHKLCFDQAASGGTGVIPFHNVPAGTDGDLYNCTVGLTAEFLALTGA